MIEILNLRESPYAGHIAVCFFPCFKQVSGHAASAFQQLLRSQYVRWLTDAGGPTGMDGYLQIDLRRHRRIRSRALVGSFVSLQSFRCCRQPLAGLSSEGVVEMIRCLAWILICMGCAEAAVAAPEQKAGAGPVCLYESKAYSEGAYICVQKSLMLTCASDGARTIWKPVGDKEFNDRCTAPMMLNYPAAPHAHAHRRHGIFHRARPLAAGSAKCFVFTGKQYCE